MNLGKDAAEESSLFPLPERFESDNGVSHVAPYWMQVKLNLSIHKHKGRTLSQAIDMVKTKFPDKSWWLTELRAGVLDLHYVYHKHKKHRCKARGDFVITESDATLSGYYHMHEDAMIAENNPTILFQDDSYVIVNKPAGMDVLSNPGAGRIFQSLPGRLLFPAWYNKNSINNNSLNDILPAHRIDNPVSGIVCCGRTAKDFKRLMRRIQLRDAHKTYLARVHVTDASLWERLEQNLPWHINAPIGFDKSQSAAFVDQTATGKPSETIIKELWKQTLARSEHGNGTVVLVIQLTTGRKHQIRCHLSEVGMPIVGDAKYGGPIDDEFVDPEARRSRLVFDANEPRLCKFYQQYFVPNCQRCQFARKCFAGTERSPALTNSSVQICLHAWKYEFPSLNMSFESPLPAWAMKKTY